MDIYHIIKKPLVTEKGTHQSTTSFPETNWKVARGGSYAFEVHPDASKTRRAKFNQLVVEMAKAQRDGDEKLVKRLADKAKQLLGEDACSCIVMRVVRLRALSLHWV